MKPVPIFMKQWLEANERTRILPGDQWYLDFSIKTLPILKESPLFKESEICTERCRHITRHVFSGCNCPDRRLETFYRGILCIIQ